MAPDKPNHGISIGNEREEGKCLRFGKISAHEGANELPVH